MFELYRASINGAGGRYGQGLIVNMGGRHFIDSANLDGTTT